MKRWWFLAVLLTAGPALAQDEPGFLERLFGTDSAESDVEQGSLLERLIEDSLSDAGRVVTVTGFSGALSGQATLDKLTIEDADGAWLTLTDATLDWNRAALFAGRLEVNELSAQEILLPRLSTSESTDAPAPEATGFELPDLPVSVEIGRIAAERVALGESVIGVAADLALDGSLSLVDGNGAADLAITRLDQPGEIALSASFESATENLSLDLSMVEGEGGIVATLAGLPGAPSVDFQITGDAPLATFEADLRLATNGKERLSGRVALSETEDAQRVVAELGGDIAPVFAPQYRAFFGDDLSLDAEALLYTDGRVHLPTFSLYAQEIALFGQVELNADRVPQVIDITGRIAPETGERVRLPLAGTPSEVARANLAVTFDAAQSDDWRAVIRLAELTRDGVAFDEMVLRATGQIGTGATSSFAGDLDFDVAGFASQDGLSDALGSNISGAARVAWDGGPFTVEDLALSAKDLILTGQASVEGAEITTDVTLSATRLANYAALANRPLSGEAMLQVTGTLNPLTQGVNLTAAGETRDLKIGDPRADAVLAGKAELDVSVVRDADGLRVALTTLESSAARLTGEASLRSGGSSAVVAGRLNETSLVVPGLNGPSDISFSGQENETRDWTVATTLTAPALSAEVSGLLSNIYDLPAFQGTINANVPDLAIFSQLANQQLSGSLSLQAEGGVNADLTRAVIDANLRGRNIKAADLGVDRLLAGPVTLSLEGSRTDDRVDITNFAFGGANLIAQVAGVITDLTGAPEFEGTVSANAPDLSVFAALAKRPLSGRLNLSAEGAAKADLSTLRIDGSAEGQDVAIGIAQVDQLLRGALSIKVDGGRDGERFEVSELSARTGSFAIETTGQLGNAGERLQFIARLNDIAPFVPGFSGAATAEGTIGRSGDAIALDIDAVGPAGTRARIAGTVAEDASTANLSIDGSAPLALANPFIAPRSLSGQSNFDLGLNGRPALESLAGRVNVANARLATPTLPTGLEDINGTIDLSRSRATLDLTGQVESGGRLTLTGPIGLTGPNSAALRIGLSQVRVTDPKLYETVADGALQIDGPLVGGARITGAITLGETNIQIPSSGLGGTGAIPEIVHLNEPPPVRGTRRKAGLLDQIGGNGGRSGPVYRLDIRISAPNRIFVRGRGLDSEFGGALQIAGTTSNIVPNGAFQLIRGRLDILGQRLALEEATITLRGGLVPVLDIRATTEADDTDIAVEVLGRADQPEIRFTSSPELPQEEVLARLIFGRGLETLSPIQAARLALAVRTLAGQGGEGIVGNIRGTAGLADLDVTTNEDGNAAVRAGAYLGENIYSDVTVDSTGETQLNLNLDVTPSLTVRGGVTNEGSSSLGIFFERDY